MYKACRCGSQEALGCLHYCSSNPVRGWRAVDWSTPDQLIQQFVGYKVYRQHPDDAAPTQHSSSAAGPTDCLAE